MLGPRLGAVGMGLSSQQAQTVQGFVHAFPGLGACLRPQEDRGLHGHEGAEPAPLVPEDRGRSFHSPPGRSLLPAK